MASKLSAPVSGGRDRNSTRIRISGLAGRGVPSGLAAVAAAGLLAACGSAGAGGSSGAAGAAGTHGAAARSGRVVSVRKLPGIGAVLADRSGKTLYSPQQEADGKIMCTGGCLNFWFPVRVAAGAALRAPGGVTGALGTIHRPGLTQLTYNGKPLYTFRLDQAPGQAHGNDFTDHFGGTTFTWHALTTGGAPAQTGGQQGNSGGYSYQSGTPGY